MTENVVILTAKINKKSNKKHAHSLCDTIWPLFTTGKLQQQTYNTTID